MVIIIRTHTEWLTVLCFRIELEFGNCFLFFLQYGVRK